MILNIYTITMLFISILTGLLAIPLVILSCRVYNRYGSSINDEGRTAIENRAYLLTLMSAVILLVKLLSWPFYYVTLQSYVDSIHGAMCIFGVTQLQPNLSNINQIFKPVVFFSISGWLILNRLDRSTETSPLFRRKFLLLSVVGLMIFTDSTADLIYFTSFDIKMFVSCCTTFFDLPGRATAVIPASLFGESYSRYILPVYYMSNLILIIFMIAAYRLRSQTDKPYPHSVTIAGAAFSLINAVIFIFAMFEVIAPDVMNLPQHRCIYCMWQYVPDTTLMTSLFIIGAFSPGWALLLNAAGRHSETELTLKTYLSRLYLMGIFCITASLILVTIHLFE